MNRNNWISSASRTLAISAALVSLASTMSAAGRKEKVLYSFVANGFGPQGNLVFDKAGNLYGTTPLAGPNICVSGGCGAVFQLIPPKQHGGSWTESVLYNFRGRKYDDGNEAVGLIADNSGNLYGTAIWGGRGQCGGKGGIVGCGVVYELSPPKQEGGAWTEKVLYSFRGGSDGADPFGNLVFDRAGNLYGAASGGGDSACFDGCGTIFELSPPQTQGGQWNEKVLYTFKGSTDSQSPNGSLIFDGVGAIYGTTLGYQSCGPQVKDCGVVFKLNPPTNKDGRWKKQLLHRFGGPDGNQPYSGVIFDATETTLYGTTFLGGSQVCTYGCGVVYSLTPGSNGKWMYAKVHGFTSGGEGSGPLAGLVMDQLGNLYGTTTGGGVYDQGRVFKLAPSSGMDGLMAGNGTGNPGSSESVRTGHGWVFSILHSFAGSPDGSFPFNGSSVTFDDVGNLYGATYSGGTSQNCGTDGCGTVFEISP